jgi:tRNA pseudouridine55 synthase
MNQDSNIILVDKPKGISSYDCIRILQKKLSIKKMGHAGTLDPLATGLLIIGVNEGTKQLHSLLGLSKVYEAEVLLGKRTDSGDITGNVVEEAPVPDVSLEKIEEVLKNFTGIQELPVPIYSAIKRQGKPLYQYVRECKEHEIEVPVKPMMVHEAQVLSKHGNVVHIRWNVGSGTYIRSLAEEFGKRLGTVATIQNLRRVSIGVYTVENAIKL